MKMTLLLLHRIALAHRLGKHDRSRNVIFIRGKDIVAQYSTALAVVGLVVLGHELAKVILFLLHHDQCAHFDDLVRNI